MTERKYPRQKLNTSDLKEMKRAQSLLTAENKILRKALRLTFLKATKRTALATEVLQDTNSLLSSVSKYLEDDK